MYILWFPKYDTVENELSFEFKKGKIERNVFAWIFKRIFTCVSGHRVVIMKTIIVRGSAYDDIRIVHISETGIIVLQLNVQIGIPIVGQMMKIFISCNQRKTCEFQRKRERECVCGCVFVCELSLHYDKRSNILQL